MNVRVTTFTNPFSFFCVIEEHSRDITLFEHQVDQPASNPVDKSISDVNHGQYIAVMWKNKWTRGIVNMESQFLIWLIDFGFYIQPNDKSVYVDLPSEFRKHPTKVFEAGVHGVSPVDKCISNDCQIESKISMSWNKATSRKCQELLQTALKTYFVPVALLSCKYNDIVLGDLYLEMPGKNIVNIIDELELWPVFLEKNNQVYVENLSKYYITRRKHRACVLKPNFAVKQLPTVSLQMSLQEYTNLVENEPELSQLFQFGAGSEDGASDFETTVQCKKNKYALTPAEIEKYSQQHITVHGRDYNMLNVLVTKARDIRMCERYKDHDLKSIGRGVCRRWTGGSGSRYP